MSDILVSQSQIFTWLTSSFPSSYSQGIHLSFRPDVAIVRQISVFDGNPDVSSDQYIINSSINGTSLIGVFNLFNNTYTTTGATQGGCSFVSNPQTMITGAENIGNTVSFQVSVLNPSGQLIPAANLLGNIAVQIDFIKYRRN